MRVEEPTSKRETRKRQHSEKEDLYSNDPFDDTDSYVLHDNYGFTSASSLSRSKRERNASAVMTSSSSSTSRVKTEVISRRDSLDAVLDSMDSTLNDMESIPDHLQSPRSTSSRGASQSRIGSSTAAATSVTNAKTSTARMIHTKKKIVPAKDGRSKGKTMITQTAPSSAEKTTKSKLKTGKKQTKRGSSTTIAATKSLTNGSTKPDQTNTNNYDIEHEISQNNLLLELSKKSVHYSPDVVNDLEEILRSPIKSRDERSSFSQSDPLGDITLSPNYFDPPPTETHQRNTRSSKRLSNRNLTKELNQAAAQATASTSTGGKSSTRQRSTARATTSTLFGKDSDTMAMHNIAMHIKQENEVSYTMNEEPPVVYTCEMCSAEFSDRAQLLVHVPVHI